MPKTNRKLLKGMQCPECESLGPFHIKAVAMVRVTDRRIESIGAHDWDENSYCDCVECNYAGSVGDFSAE